jgi:hypothetical protein
MKVVSIFIHQYLFQRFFHVNLGVGVVRDNLSYRLTFKFEVDKQELQNKFANVRSWINSS